MPGMATQSTKQSLTAERLRELLEYDPETGVFKWKVANSPRVRVGDATGHICRKGYSHIGVDGFVYLAHRLAWLWMTGAFPVEEIDHINGARSDNRFANLRQASKHLNSQNRHKPSSRNKVGFLGVTAKKKGFQASISVDGNHRYLGLFNTEELAHLAYLAEKRRSHPFGEIARDSAITPPRRRARSDTSVSGLTGVTWHNNRWLSRLGVNGKKKHLGYFDTAVEASQAYLDFKMTNSAHSKIEGQYGCV